MKGWVAPFESMWVGDVGGGAKLVGVSFRRLYDAPPFRNATMTAKLLICHGRNDPLPRRTPWYVWQQS